MVFTMKLKIDMILTVLIDMVFIKILKMNMNLTVLIGMA